MRTISAALTTAQRAATRKPYIRLELISRDQTDVLTYTTRDTVNRIISVRAAEGMYGGSIAQTDQGIVVAAQLILQNHDQHFKSKDLRGYKVNIGWGFETPPGTGAYSEGEPFWIITQREYSEAGVSVVELLCFSAWQYNDLKAIMGDAIGGLYQSKDQTIRHAMMDIFTADADSVQQDDGGSFTDETTDAGDNGADDVLPLPTTPATNDAFYIGDGDIFDRVSQEITTAGVGTWTITWEYYNGSWTALSNVVDNTTGFTVAGLKVLSYDLPTDWQDVSVNGTTKKWIRGRVSAFTSITTQPKIGRLGINRHWGVQVDTSDGIENDYKPLYIAEYARARGRVVRDLTLMMQSKVLMKKLEWIIDQFTPSPASADYTYDIDDVHTFFSSGRETSLVIPNRITAVDNAPERHLFSGTDNDATSQGDIGIVMEIIENHGITSNTIAASVASRKLEHIVQASKQGEVIAPMQINQEPWDWVEIKDPRMNQTYTGRVGNILREYIPANGIYQISIGMGARIDFKDQVQADPKESGSPSFFEIFDGPNGDSPVASDWLFETSYPGLIPGHGGVTPVNTLIMSSPWDTNNMYVIRRSRQAASDAEAMWRYDNSAKSWTLRQAMDIANRVTGNSTRVINTMAPMRNGKIFLPVIETTNSRIKSLAIYTISSNSWADSAVCPDDGANILQIDGLCFESDDIAWVLLVNVSTKTDWYIAKYVVSTDTWTLQSSAKYSSAEEFTRCMAFASNKVYVSLGSGATQLDYATADVTSFATVTWATVSNPHAATFNWMWAQVDNFMFYREDGDGEIGDFKASTVAFADSPFSLNSNAKGAQSSFQPDNIMHGSSNNTPDKFIDWFRFPFDTPHYDFYDGTGTNKLKSFDIPHWNFDIIVFKPRDVFDVEIKGGQLNGPITVDQILNPFRVYSFPPGVYQILYPKAGDYATITMQMRVNRA